VTCLESNQASEICFCSHTRITNARTHTHRITYHWIKGQIELEEEQKGFDRSKYSHSMVVGTLKPTDLGTLRQADGAETFEAKK
jgi:hypothetical protein